MFAEVHCPETLSPEQLDAYLQRGWFRMAQTIFTTNFLNFKGNFYSALWLRIPLSDITDEGSFQKLLKRNKAFTVSIQRASVTPQKEALFALYKTSISFEASASLHTLLYGKSTHEIYNTYEVTLHDNDRLIAAGFFDIGETSAAGISSFYDPAYRKYSLGKYLIHLKIAYCKTLGLQYFFPGYFVPGYPLFDYKLEIGKPHLQFLEFTTQTWRPITSFSALSTPLQIMRNKLEALQQLLWKNGIQGKVLKYEFFDANLIPELQGIVLFDFPLFLSFSDFVEEHMVVYDIRDQQFHWIKCRSVWASSAGASPEDVYSSNVFKFDREIFSSPQPEVIVDSLAMELKSESKILRERLI